MPVQFLSMEVPKRNKKEIAVDASGDVHPEMNG
jgi:hypothetical protein